MNVSTTKPNEYANVSNCNVEYYTAGKVEYQNEGIDNLSQKQAVSHKTQQQAQKSYFSAYKVHSCFIDTREVRARDIYDERKDTI